MVDTAGAILAILTRAPSSGGKSRLFQALGMQPDVELLRCLLLDTLDGATLPALRRVLVVTPGSACDEVREIVSEASRPSASSPTSQEVSLDVMPQIEGDLGARMQAVMATLFREGATAVALIGSDLPHIVPRTIAETFHVLARDRDALVLGPAADGGYYLIASRRLPDVFAGIEWGSDRVFARTREAATIAGFHVHQLPVLSDVDTLDDLRAAAASGRALRTAAWARMHTST
jgi:rSAM/selenodomain-associated transferase 1